MAFNALVKSCAEGVSPGYCGLAEEKVVLVVDISAVVAYVGVGMSSCVFHCIGREELV